MVLVQRTSKLQKCGIFRKESREVYNNISGLNIDPAKIHPPSSSCPNPLCCVYVTCVSMRQHELLSNMFSQIKGMCLKC